jgi:hypothetical protein
MYCDKKTFSELNIGDIFTFSFDSGDWRYKKIGFDTVECVKCPRTTNAVGQIDRWNNQNAEVFHHNENA